VADAGPSAQANGHSTSVMFIIYMVIGFTATLACIMVLTLLYFLIRYVSAMSSVPPSGQPDHPELCAAELCLSRLETSKSQASLVSARAGSVMTCLTGLLNVCQGLVTCYHAGADASYGGKGRQTVIQRAQTAVWPCLPEKYT